MIRTELKKPNNGTDINKVYMYRSKTLGGIFREKKTTDSSRDGWTGVRREEKFKYQISPGICYVFWEKICWKGGY